MPLQLVRNDITHMNVDAIVNAANPSLLGGGGVDGAIHRAAGPKLLEECRTLGGCRTGEAKLTRGYDLPCKYVIHTVGPVWEGGGRGERALLNSCYRSSLALADEMGCESVAFPLISSGVYGYPREEAMHVAIEAITQFLLTHEMTVYLTLFSRDAFRIGGRLFRDVTAYIDDVYADEHDDSSRRPRFRRVEPADRMREPVYRGLASRPSAAPSLDEHADEHDDSSRRPRFRRVEPADRMREPGYRGLASHPSAALSLDEHADEHDDSSRRPRSRRVEPAGRMREPGYRGLAPHPSAAPSLDEHDDSSRRPRFRRVEPADRMREPAYRGTASRPSAAPSLDEHDDEHDDSSRRSRFCRVEPADRMREPAYRGTASRPSAAPSLDEHDDEHDDSSRRPRFRRVEPADRMREPAYRGLASRPSAAPSLDEMLSQLDAGFAETLLRLIDERGMTDAECYKRANVDRRLFNKIKNNPDYRPSKPTVLAFAIALRLSLEQTNDLMTRAGYALSRSSRFDVVMEYCIRNHEYNLMEINAVLFDLDLPPLGC